MIPKSDFYLIIKDQFKEVESINKLISRSKFKDVLMYSGAAAVVIKGVRRCGKSTLLMQLIKAKFYNNFLYFNFDDERIINFQTEDFQTLMEALIEVIGDKKNLFFDEIQNIKGWELFVNRLLRQGYRIFITGSNANLLSKELGTYMTGRHVDITLYPFSFKEFLIAKDISLNLSNKFYSTTQKAQLVKLFRDYMINGGMPEAVIFSNEFILMQIINDILQKDIINRYNIRKSSELKSITKFIIANSSNMITYSSIVNNFKINSQNTIQKYIDYLEETYLIFEVKKFERKIKKFDKNPKKVYCVDTGIITQNIPSSIENLGNLLENIVAIQLKRLNKNIFYYKSLNGREVDFIIPDDKEIVQVCYELNINNSDREITGIIDATNELKFKNAVILTFDQEKEIKYKNKKINVKPVWKWLLESGI
ncbi:MAG: ATP-binding protein [Candidatus Marsarchaeota archaeon]|jgi:predicted AAA+ superfamily ATPase|nr:ATP-binding protein [Candidatus Marsarchaeota archaeon]